MQLRAGRIEFTDININVSALEELLPQLSFQLESAHVGSLRVEISYTKLLTESLAFFLDDVSIVIAPPVVGADEVNPAEDADVGDTASEFQAEGISTAVLTDKRNRFVSHLESCRPTVQGGRDPGGGLPCNAQTGNSGEGLDFLAHWIEQITSKVKIALHNVTVRVESTARHEPGDAGGDDGRGKPFLEVRCRFMKWSDESPETPVLVAETPRPAHGSVAGGDRFANLGKHVSGALAQKVSC